eukprot:1157346-Pelagomonas_calceolata.AAC.10
MRCADVIDQQKAKCTAKENAQPGLLDCCYSSAKPLPESCRSAAGKHARPRAPPYPPNHPHPHTYTHTSTHTHTHTHIHTHTYVRAQAHTSLGFANLLSCLQPPPFPCLFARLSRIHDFHQSYEWQASNAGIDIPAATPFLARTLFLDPSSVSLFLAVLFCLDKTLSLLEPLPSWLHPLSLAHAPSLPPLLDPAAFSTMSLCLPLHKAACNHVLCTSAPIGFISMHASLLASTCSIYLYQDKPQLALAALDQAVSSNFAIREFPLYHVVNAKVLMASERLEEARKCTHSQPFHLMGHSLL